MKRITNIALLPLWALCINLSLISSASTSPLKSDETLICLPTSASYDAQEDIWTLPIHVWVFEPRSEFAHLMHTWGVTPEDEEEESIFRVRARPFVVDSERNKDVVIQLGAQRYKLTRSGPNGHIHDQIILTDKDMQRLLAGEQAPTWLEYTVVMPQGDERVFFGRIQVIPYHGLSVISDIDDTIKESNVVDTRELLANTFLRPFVVVPKMVDVYRHWQDEHGLSFHYVSASPWPLFMSLEGFTHSEGYPEGTWHLKHMRLSDPSLFNLFADPVAYKLEILDDLLERYPKQRFILVGDSGEKDPEIYATLAHKYPTQIVKVLIRAVDRPADDPRFARAFAGVERERWHVFTDPEEIRDPFNTPLPAPPDDKKTTNKKGST